MNFKLHPEFKLNGKIYSEKNLLNFAQELSNADTVFEQETGSFIVDFLDKKDTILVQTSGSTGTPKKIEVGKQQMLNSAEATGNFFDLPPKTTAILCMPVSYIAGKLMLVRAMHLGWQLDTYTPAGNPLKNVDKTYDFAAMTPFQVARSLKNLYKIKKLIIGGGAIATSLRKKLQEVSTIIYETYGMTETLTHIAAKKVNHKQAKEEVPFTVLPNVEISQNKENCLCIYAPKVNPGKIQTTDVIELVDKQHFYWKGRADNVINSGGVKIHPEEVERKLSKILSRRFFIAGLPNQDLGEKVVLFMEGLPEKENKNNLENKIKELPSLKKYEIPKAIIWLKTFEETHTGKINRPKTIQKIEQ